MKCSEAHGLLTQFVDDALDPESRRSVEKHLATCGECTAELEALNAYLTEMRFLEKVKAPPTFLHEVRERIKKESSSRGFFDWLISPLYIKLPMGLAGALAMAFLFLLIYPGFKGQMENTRTPQVQEPLPEPAASEETGKIATQKDSDQDRSEVREAQPGGSSRAEKPIQLTLLIKPSPGIQGSKKSVASEMDTTSSGESAVGSGSQDSKQKASSTPPREMKTSPSPAASSPAAIPKPESAKSLLGERSQGETARHFREKPQRLSQPRGAVPLADTEAIDKRDMEELPEVEKAVSEIWKSVFAFGGNVLSIVHGKRNHLLTSIAIQIPADKVPLLLKDLQSMGQISTSHSGELEIREQKMIRVDIKVMSPLAD